MSSNAENAADSNVSSVTLGKHFLVNQKSVENVEGIELIEWVFGGILFSESVPAVFQTMVMQHFRSWQLSCGLEKKFVILLSNSSYLDPKLSGAMISVQI